MEEIEAKLLVRSSDMERLKPELLSLRSVGPYVLREPPDPVTRIQDTYYDTPDWHLRRRDMSLRVRKLDGTTKITLKGQHSQDGAVHTREELEKELDAKAAASILVLLGRRGLIPADLVDSVVGAPGDDPLAAFALCGLSPIAAVDNTRHLREVVADEVMPASLSFDEIRLSCGQASKRELEIEIEARSPSARTVVEEMARELQNRYPRIIEPIQLSKLERALRLVRNSQPE
jgi:inorganic triphosphatase YgiF